MIDLTTDLVSLIPQLFALLGLTLAQIILGVAIALKNKVFEWQKLADFYSTIIAPRILSWLACMIIFKSVPQAYLPSELSSGLQTFAFLFVVLAFTGSIIANLRALGVLSDNVTLDKIGLPAKNNKIDVE